VGIGAFCGAMVGAKLPFLIAQYEPGEGFAAWMAHGKTIMGGIVGGYLGVEIAKWSLDVRVKTGDSFAAPVAVAVAIGRLACFQGGCCYGAPTTLPWGMRFPLAADASDLPRHPTQLYEFAFHLLAAITLVVLQRRDVWRGQLMKAYLLAYCLYRFGSEFLRPEPTFWGGLTAYQWAALGLIPVFAGLWWRDARQAAAASPEACGAN
jgi:phosphatidylglycerol:prolipoprotein diacylglycerol transferase